MSNLQGFLGFMVLVPLPSQAFLSSRGPQKRQWKAEVITSVSGHTNELKCDLFTEETSL